MAEERSLGQLVADATHDVTELVRGEVALAKAELRADLKNGAAAGGMFGIAGYLCLVASILLFIAAGYGLAEAGLPRWAAFLVLGVALLIIAGLLALVGRSRIAKLGPPERAIRSTKEAIAVVKPGSSHEL